MISAFLEAGGRKLDKCEDLKESLVWVRFHSQFGSSNHTSIPSTWRIKKMNLFDLGEAQKDWKRSCQHVGSSNCKNSHPCTHSIFLLGPGFCRNCKRRVMVVSPHSRDLIYWWNRSMTRFRTDSTRFRMLMASTFLLLRSTQDKVKGIMIELQKADVAMNNCQMRARQGYPVSLNIETSSPMEP